MADKNFNIAEVLRDTAKRYSGWPGLAIRKKKGDYDEWTLGQLHEESTRFAAVLREEGISPGDRVMLMVRPSMEFICLTFALFQVGAVVILIDPGMGYRNLLRCITSVKPHVLIGIPAAQLFSRIFFRHFATVKTRVCVGRSFVFLGKSLTALTTSLSEQSTKGSIFQATEDDVAAIIFTTGSTGPPKGVRFSHGNFRAQLRLIHDYYGIRFGDVDQPCFPLFALFSAALGAKTVIPEMDAARPAQVDPEKFIRTLVEQKVTYSFGSPAIWNVVSRYCQERNITLPVKKILMAGAPVSGELIKRVKNIMVEGGEIHTPYGATESLPVSSISGTDILGETWPETVKGHGVCVGNSLPGIDITVVEARDEEIVHWSDARELGVGEIGEIVVRGPVVTRAYDNNDYENKLAKITDGQGFRHRVGDMGYKDEQDRLWFCGRKAHRVFTAQGILYTIPCEAIFNQHSEVYRSALVGVGKSPNQQPVIIAEPHGKVVDEAALKQELHQLAKANPLTADIETFLIHP
ncbi:MAG: fatty acid CoA ligase family protein, partial [Desulfobulbaceae bacterium]|nr:fatty acid CoA ligase family protein [Desulfobulbaceae bacterium]